ncbi:transglutaminase family protein, partial [Methylobacterium sp. J-026]|nr:transglutaminase family protein [Methylobacterium sp. J-026]
MKIKTGFDIAFTMSQPTPMILMLTVHPSRMPDVLTPHVITFDPPIPARAYQDVFDNTCHRILAPPGQLTVSADITVQDSGLPDPVVPEARQIAVQDLPDAVLMFLLGSRYCDTDKLSQTAWSLFGSTPEGWARVQAIVDYAHER